MSGLRLHDPLWLAALLPALAVLFWSGRRERRAVLLYSSLDAFRNLPVTLAQRAKRLLPLLRLLGLLLVACALARPQEGREEFRVRSAGICIQLLVDRSGSMDALDFREDGQPVNRLHAVKRVIRDFVAGAGDLPGRPDDQIGLVVFGGYAESRCPLTLDHDALLAILERVEIPGAGLSDQERALAERVIEGEAATAIGDALALGVSRLRGANAKSRVIVLLSDGESNAGALDPLAAAELALAEGVKVYTIGIGSTGIAPFQRFDHLGRAHLVPDHVRLDERTLARIAELTEGRYFNARDSEALVRVYEEIDRLEKSETEGVLYTDYRELFEYLLLPGAGLLLLELLLCATRFLTLP
ncbi:MAG: VWA domain-containing protein [Planctomycetes bacterium]|nr:VWA domain-containing protein [Planctomycetota bacterium]